jgi:hypothetical protein
MVRSGNGWPVGDAGIDPSELTMDHIYEVIPWRSADGRWRVLATLWDGTELESNDSFKTEAECAAAITDNMPKVTRLN